MERGIDMTLAWSRTWPDYTPPLMQTPSPATTPRVPAQMYESDRQALRRLTAANVKIARSLAKADRKMRRELPRFRAAMQAWRAALDRSYRV